MTRVQTAAATLSGNSLRQTVHTHCASVHQAAKLVAALLRVAGVTADLAESNGRPTAGFMTHITKYRDKLRNHTLGSRAWAAFTFFTQPKLVLDLATPGRQCKEERKNVRYSGIQIRGEVI